MRSSTVLILALLVGCADGALGKRGSPAWNMTASPEAKREFYQFICMDEKGYRLGTQEMEICIRSEPTPNNLKFGSGFVSPQRQENSGYEASSNSFEKDYQQQKARECARIGKLANVYGECVP